jgi:CBS domain containing-hemolysin-like protein
VDTVAGLVYALFGRVPAQGETISLPGAEFRVEKTLGQRITKVRITRTTPAPQEEAATL